MGKIAILFVILIGFGVIPKIIPHHVFKDDFLVSSIRIKRSLDSIDQATVHERYSGKFREY